MSELKTSLKYSRNILNVVVVGQSGVGKSSFLNYMAGQDYFKTGVGEAVTKGYFEKYEVEHGKVTYALFDTEGLEAGKVDKWEDNILSEIRKRDESRDMTEWFHSILFCISAESKRIQPFEIDAIRRMLRGGHVMILLTKKDKVSQSTLTDMEEEIRKQVGDQVDILSVCSVNQKFRNGTQSKREGLEDVLKTTFVGLWKKMAKMIPSILLKNVMYSERAFILPTQIKGYIAWYMLNMPGGTVYDLSTFYKIFDSLGVSKNNIGSNSDVSVSAFRKFNQLDCNIFYSYQMIINGNFRYTTVLSLPASLSKSVVDWGMFLHGFELYLSQWEIFYSRLTTAIKALSIESLLNSIEKTIETCKQLYFQITGISLEKQVSLFDIRTALTELKNLSNARNLYSDYQSVKEAIKDVLGCTFFSGSERDWLIREYGTFKSRVDSFLKDYNMAINAVTKSIQQELRSFADYTLRESSDTSKREVIKMDLDEFSTFITLIRQRMRSYYEWNAFVKEVYSKKLFDEETRKRIVQYGEV